MKSLFLTTVLSGLLQLCSAAGPAFDEWEHGRVQLKDVSIHFRYAGSGPPLLLVHGNPQHSLTWRLIGPLLTDSYTVIAPDNRGMGDSSIPADGDYSSEAMASDLSGLLDALQIDSALVFSHDKGCGPAAALAATERSRVKAIGFSEYGLPGFGYEMFWVPNPSWDLYANWQLAFFSVPDAAEFFIRGREKEMLSWYFFHASYSGTEALPNDVLDRYAASIAKPGFLKGMLGPFATYTVAADNTFFNKTIRQQKLDIPMLVLGGEASIAPVEVLKMVWGDVATTIEADIVPKAGHWIADENPVWVADKILEFFGDFAGSVPTVDLAWYRSKVTMVPYEAPTKKNRRHEEL